jgi:hypothetical protein
MGTRRVLFYFSCFAGAWICFSVVGLLADEPTVLHGGLSPNGKLSVIVGKDNNWYSSGPESAVPSAGELDNSKVYLYDETNQKVIGPLEEVDTMAGGFGTSLSNVKAFWSVDSQLLALSFRSGRLNNSTIVYRILPFKNTSRAIPQQLPLDDSGPSGKDIFSHLFHRANGGVGVERWLSRAELEVVEYGLMPPDPPGIAGNYFNDDGEIGIVYSYSRNKWEIERFIKPGILGTANRPIQATASSPDGKLQVLIKYPGSEEDSKNYPGNKDKYSSITLKDNAGKTLYENDRAFASSPNNASWEAATKSVRITTPSGEWIFVPASHELTEAP